MEKVDYMLKVLWMINSQILTRAIYFIKTYFQVQLEPFPMQVRNL